MVYFHKLKFSGNLWRGKKKKGALFSHPVSILQSLHLSFAEYIGAVAFPIPSSHGVKTEHTTFQSPINTFFFMYYELKVLESAELLICIKLECSNNSGNEGQT